MYIKTSRSPNLCIFVVFVFVGLCDKLFLNVFFPTPFDSKYGFRIKVSVFIVTFTIISSYNALRHISSYIHGGFDSNFFAKNNGHFPTDTKCAK